MTTSGGSTDVDANDGRAEVDDAADDRTDDPRGDSNTNPGPLLLLPQRVAS